MTLYLILASTSSAHLFVPYSYIYFLTTKNHLKKYLYFFLSIVAWLSEEIGFSYAVADGNQMTSPRKQKILNLAGSWQQDVLCRCDERLSIGVRESPSEDVPKNFVFHADCGIKSIFFCPCHLVWPFRSDMIAF